MTAPTEAVELLFRHVSAGDGEQAELKARSIYVNGEWLESRVYGREALVPGESFAGPTLITEHHATTQ